MHRTTVPEAEHTVPEAEQCTGLPYPRQYNAQAYCTRGSTMPRPTVPEAEQCTGLPYPRLNNAQDYCTRGWTMHRTTVPKAGQCTGYRTQGWTMHRTTVPEAKQCTGWLYPRLNYAQDYCTRGWTVHKTTVPEAEQCTELLYPRLKDKIFILAGTIAKTLSEAEHSDWTKLCPLSMYHQTDVGRYTLHHQSTTAIIQHHNSLMITFPTVIHSLIHIY